MNEQTDFTPASTEPVVVPPAPAPALSDAGIRCRAGGCTRMAVIYTRARPGAKLVRRRQCRQCGTRVTTWEREIGIERNE